MMWRFSGDDSGEECIPHMPLTAALCQHRHKQDASHYWWSTKSSILKKLILLLREKKWKQLADGTEGLIKCMIVTDKPYFNCFEYKFWKIPWFSVLICWKFWCKQSLLPNHLKWIAICWRANTAASVIVHTQIQFFSFSHSCHSESFGLTTWNGDLKSDHVMWLTQWQDYI